MRLDIVQTVNTMLDDLDLRDLAGRATSVVDDLEAQFQHTNAHGIRISGQMHTISVDAGRNAGALTLQRCPAG